MPYIQSDRRRELHKLSFTQLLDIPLTSGDLNYLISCLLWSKHRQNTCYETVNSLVGVLECVKQEYYRRQAVPYEKTKIKENGDLKFYTREGYNKDILELPDVS